MAEATQAKFACPGCGTRYTWKTEIAGKKVKCRCGQVMNAPATEPGSAAPKPETPAPKPKASAPKPPPLPPSPPAAKTSPKKPPEDAPNPAFLDMDDADDGADEAPAEPMPARGGGAKAAPARARSAPAEKSKASAGFSGMMNAENWKWWHFIVVGALIAAYSIFEISSGAGLFGTRTFGFFGRRRSGPLGGLILGVACIAIGLFSRPKKGS